MNNEELDYLDIINKIKNNNKVKTYISHCADLAVLEKVLNSSTHKSFDNLICYINEKVLDSIEKDNLDKASELISLCSDVVDNSCDYFVGGINIS